uniref:Uncharacterized protein n=1 Tax=Oryza sativa subsp. japonica TaxID=39947 RepID=Q6Z6S2_ORYSJ|nr:hypothetical protein [Oryza sativa Japonica Group]
MARTAEASGRQQGWCRRKRTSAPVLVPSRCDSGARRVGDSGLVTIKEMMMGATFARIEEEIAPLVIGSVDA